MRHLVYDLEMTCWNTKMHKDKKGFYVIEKDGKRIDLQFPQSELIEIGAVMLDDKFRIIGRFQSYVKPVHSKLSQYCLELTGIKQEDIDNAEDFECVFTRFFEWAGFGDDLITYAWSKNDKRQLQNELLSKKANFNKDDIMLIFKKHHDLQKEFSNKVNEKYKKELAEKGVKNELLQFPERIFSLKTALNILNIKSIKEFHKAINDAEYTAQILQFLRSGKQIEIFKRQSLFKMLLTTLRSKLEIVLMRWQDETL